MAESSCRYFSGYKPCRHSRVCDRGQCSQFSPVSERILIVHLGALGAVLRSTSLLAAIKRRFPQSHITWVTKHPADSLLQNIPAIDRVLTLDVEDLLALKTMRFDSAFVIDKSAIASGVLASTTVERSFGFTTNALGAVLPLNPEAAELWQIGLSNELKFKRNQKTEQRLVHEALCLGDFRRDEYQVNLSFEEIQLRETRRRIWAPHNELIIGINTGASAVLPAKKLTVEGHCRLIDEIRKTEKIADLPIVLLGGNEDQARNYEIAAKCGHVVIQSPTERGIRDGLVSVAACDIVFSGDSLGMHMAIGLKKWVVAWFGPTVAAEIDLYERGNKILTQAPCSPCWKRFCDVSPMCYDQLDLKAATRALAEGMDWQISLYKPHIRETYYSPSL